MSSPDEAHSELYFTDARDHWWNEDFVALLAERAGLSRARRVLDVGAGQGHFSRLWLRQLPAGFELVGVEPEARSRAVAEARTASVLSHERIDGSARFVDGRAEALPFDDASFDAVLCQTVLMHLRDPSKAVDEMTRVLRPGGVLLAAEPNNLGSLQRFAARGPEADPQPLLDEARYLARCMRGKHALGEGWNNLGASLPRLFSRLERVRFYVNDRPCLLAPPYNSPADRAAIADLRSHVERGVFVWYRADARRYFTAGGGGVDEFEALYDALLAHQRDELARIERGEHLELTAVTQLVAVGHKPL